MKSNLVSVLTRIDNFLGAQHIREIDKEINSHILQAHVPPTVVYTQKVIDWIGTPEEMEAEFTERKGRIIPEEYLVDVEDQLENIVYYIVNGKLYSNHSHVIYGYIFSYPSMNRVVFAVTYVRPCAEGYGFLRLLLYQIARVAYANGFDMHIDDPYPAMLAILTRTFGKRNLQEYGQEEDYVGGEKKGWKTKRYVVAHAELEDAFSKLGVDMYFSGTPAPYPERLQLKRAAFPTADKLNNG
jgi:hypothetical protein